MSGDGDGVITFFLPDERGWSGSGCSRSCLWSGISSSRLSVLIMPLYCHFVEPLGRVWSSTTLIEHVDAESL